MSENSPFKRGIVRELKPEKAQARVEFEDEDGVSSYWLSVNSALASGTGSRVYAMPEIGSQVHCLIDWRGEDGCILGASYSDKDPPPATDPNHIAMMLGGGLELTYDKAAGGFVLKVPANMKIESGAINLKGPVTIEGPVTITGDILTHNGKNVGSDHSHVSAPDGPPGPPV
ncbi:phage baseplate assembly protein V [Camelimonas lactis]|uniref:Phage baseplate assembly protein V n=1 Tax=Camelimonas lactis TaxID=659006 RepID=A0A4R2GWQ4_9HYPH|nr:phage baseplate assembly protein V [Camelimonas lactis]TCO15234.1 phage baseplate assembly protein V [Camelimonas lactis]